MARRREMGEETRNEKRSRGGRVMREREREWEGEDE